MQCQVTAARTQAEKRTIYVAVKRKGELHCRADNLIFKTLLNAHVWRVRLAQCCQCRLAVLAADKNERTVWLSEMLQYR